MQSNFGVFEAVTIKLTKANINQHNVTYTVTVSNKDSHATVTISKSDDDFVKLQGHICNALDRGHSCDALCPWFFVDVQGKLPKKPWFRSTSHVRVVEARLNNYQDLLDVVVTFINSPHNRSCCRAKERVPAVLFDFLFRDNELDPSMYKTASPKNGRLSTSSQHRLSEPLDCVAMEKELYEESIRCLEARLKDLQNGTLDEFVERCKAFELAKTYQIDLAALHRKLLLRNIDELLAFDFQQIDDGFNASLEALQSTAPPNVAQQVEPVAESPHATAVVTDSDDPVRHELKQLELEKHLHFSMDHVNTCLPAATVIQAQLQALRDSLDIVNEKLRHATLHYYADEADTVYAGNVILYVGDAVVLTSEIAQEDFYGSIHAIDESAV
ncbi:hypothetical protein DYB37_010690 [Aphanomyces astaci]|uniref:PX domain-containing protein n=1 Tax=Aphanomyces astaci TaxID=112090 RepID=A0A3R6YBW3_APHAT|nr:hypothetical protein DYB35_009930 [Aphanomyces astaci]RHZ08846.1 hypothetical protein DYB37_010690 [Aphanomyces astaci]